MGPVLLFYLSEEFYNTEQKMLNTSILLFQSFKDQTSWKLLRRRLSFVSLSYILGTIFLSKSLISGIFLKSNRWFQKNDAKNID